MTSNKGINYAGFTNTNRDNKTGIRYGVISQNEVLQAWADSSEPDYGDPTCPKCGNKAKPCKRRDYRTYEYAKHECADFVCTGCKYVFGSESAYGDEPNGWAYESNGYSATCGEDGDIFILKSPYFTYAQFCSPCAPGACYLMNSLDAPCEDNKAYCFGHDWFDGNKAPYPVMSVKTGLPVQPE